MTNKIMCVVYMAVGSLLLFSALPPTLAVLFLGKDPNYLLIGFEVIVGAGLIWRSTKLWNRWRLPLGIICLICYFPFFLGGFSNYQTQSGAANNTVLNRPVLLIAQMLSGVIGTVIGITLIALQKRLEKTSKALS